jgi:hypothetical protein
MRLIVQIILLTFLFPCCLLAQRYSGVWFGRAEARTTLTYNSYLCELTILKKGTKITGDLNYFFGQDEYNTKISGFFHAASGTIELDPFKLITFFAENKNAPDCLMDGSLTLYIDGRDSVLYGQLNPVAKYRNSCPVMTISLHKEAPEEQEQEDEMIEQPRTLLIGVETSNKKVESSPEIIQSRPAEPPLLIKELNSRVFSVGPLILVDTDSIELHLYDNGKIDHDSVSVFFNRQPVLQNQPLGLKPVIIGLVLHPGENEIAMFAENLGTIPPNTALCIIYAGGKRFDINLSSSLDTNGTVRIKKRMDIR